MLDKERDAEAEPHRIQGEFCYVDEAGQLQDRDIHEAILAEGDDSASLRGTIERVRAAGWSEERIRLIYGDPPASGANGG